MPIWEGVYRTIGWAVIAIPVGVLCLIGLGLFNLFNGDIVSYVAVSHQPESELIYPGASLAGNRTVGSRTDAFFGEYYPAFTSSVLMTEASSDAIRRWYRMRLISDGWTDDGDGTSYRRPGQRIHLSFVAGRNLYSYDFGFDCGDHKNCDSKFPPG